MMRFGVFAYLLSVAAGVQVAPAAGVQVAPAEGVQVAPAAIVQVAPAASTQVAPVAGVQVAPDIQKETGEKNIFDRIGHDLQSAHVRAKSASEKAKEKAKAREDSAAGRLNVLKMSLPRVRAFGNNLCQGKPASLCEIRMKMFKGIADWIESGDVKVVEMLRKSVQLLQDFSHMNDDLRGAISSLTLYELADRPPLGMKIIADINPRDGKVDRYEWSEYMKAVYLFTLTNETAHALYKPKMASPRLTKFVSWNLRDEARPKNATEALAKPHKHSKLQAQIPANTPLHMAALVQPYAPVHEPNA